MLETICLNARRIADRAILILQIAKLFIELDRPDHAARCYKVISTFASQTQLPEEFKQQYRNIYGDHENGFITYEEKLTFEQIKMKYTRKFKHYYEILYSYDDVFNS